VENTDMGKTIYGASGRRIRTALVAACLLAAPLVAPAPATAQTAAAVETPFAILPLAGEVISAFGPRANPNGGEPQFHSGVDFDAPEGAAIVAPAAGRVTRAESRAGWGNLLEIDHGGGLVTRYAHLSGFEAREGQNVAAGQLIARVGSTGRSTVPHLHFMVLRDGRPVDPESVLPPR
jgi:murein DD-endopeptidase MepM/ murein hydrolase activator NlpD